MSEKKSFWTTTIGVITAITGLLAAIGGLLGGLIAADIIGGDTTTKVVLTISTTEGGRTNPEPGKYSFDKDSQVNITAIADYGWEFDKWSEDYTGSSSSVKIVLDDDMGVTANFVRKKYSLTTQSLEGGSISPSGGTYDSGTQVILTASAESGWEFDTLTRRNLYQNSLPLRHKINGLSGQSTELLPKPCVARSNRARGTLSKVCKIVVSLPPFCFRSSSLFIP